jgi:hypothetical protein
VGGKARKRGRGPERIGEILDKMFKSRALRREPPGITGLRSRWEEVVGPDLAGSMVPVKAVDGVLFVRVESSALFFEMTNFGSDKLLKRIDDILPGKFRGIRFLQ